ncbi:MAG: GTP cyclohydrolase, FolE2/MptA family, partial [Pseudomonadota bacterium]
MNMIPSPMKSSSASAPSSEEAREALETLRRLAAADPAEAAALGLSALAALRPGAATALNRDYPEDFEVDAAYKASLPDLQNGPESLIKGARTGIQHVGISNFRLPLQIKTRDGDAVTLETSVTGSVSLEATKKGINMSRIMRSFYRHANEPFNFEKIEAVLQSYLDDLDSI